jgi:hypothetical protein
MSHKVHKLVYIWVYDFKIDFRTKICFESRKEQFNLWVKLEERIEGRIQDEEE